MSGMGSRLLPAAACLAAMLASGCARSRLGGTQGVDCGAAGERVVVAYSAFCVYAQALPEACPAELPFELTDGEVFFCSGDPAPPDGLLSAARAAASDGGPSAPSPDALVGQPAFDAGVGGAPDLAGRDARPVPDFQVIDGGS